MMLSMFKWSSTSFVMTAPKWLGCHTGFTDQRCPQSIHPIRTKDQTFHPKVQQSMHSDRFLFGSAYWSVIQVVSYHPSVGRSQITMSLFQNGSQQLEFPKMKFQYLDRIFDCSMYQFQPTGMHLKPLRHHFQLFSTQPRLWDLPFQTKVCL